MKQPEIEYISEAQKTIVNSDSILKLINGCAGSRKTDTLIKCAIRDLYKYNTNILFLTFVSSVTDEIKNRVATMLDIKINDKKTNKIKKNKITATKNKCSIEISTIDSWIHTQLKELISYEDMAQIGGKFDLKVKMLNELIFKENVGHFRMDNKKEANLILIDEFQDTDYDKLEVIMNIWKVNKKTRIYCVGDYLQTIFIKDMSNHIYNKEHNNTLTFESRLKNHPMNYFKTFNPEYFNLNMYYRCPKAHIDFVNYITEEFQQKYGLKKMIANNKNVEDKPLLFIHRKTKDKHNAHELAEQIGIMINTILEEDKDITIGDIAIISNKTNNNQVFSYLKKELTKIYEKKEIKDGVIHLNTDDDGVRKSISWTDTDNKTVMLSIHGDKGKGHKVVIFIGLNNDEIPFNNNLFKYDEITDESLLNVALTRSTKYLLVGFCYDSMSMYIHNKYDRLDKYAYLSWKSYDNIPDKYRKIIIQNNKIYEINFEELENTFKPDLTISTKYIKSALDIPDKRMYSVKADISKHVEDYVFKHNNKEFYFEMENINKLEFGEKFFIKFDNTKDETEKEEFRMIFGTMAELMILRRINFVLFSCILSKYIDSNNIYFDDEKILSVWYDIKKLSSISSLNIDIKSDFNKIINSLNDIKIKEIVSHAKENNKNIYNKKISQNEIQDMIKILLNSNNNNEDIESKYFWNLSVIYSYTHDETIKPYLLNYLDRYNDDMKIIHSNINKYLELLDKKHIISHGDILHLITKITNEEQIEKLGYDKNIHKTIYKNGITYGINGVIDFYNKSENKIIEIKASNMDTVRKEWIMQCYMYCMIKGINRFSIINICQGVLYNYDISKSYDMIQQSVIKSQLLKRLFIHDFIINGF